MAEKSKNGKKEEKDKEENGEERKRPSLGRGLAERAARRLERRDNELERKIKEAEKGSR